MKQLYFDSSRYLDIQSLSVQLKKKKYIKCNHMNVNSEMVFDFLWWMK